MFSEDKFNELMKNLKAGKDVPTPRPEPAPKPPKNQKNKAKAPVQRPVGNDIGGWLEQVDVLRSKIIALEAENTRLEERHKSRSLEAEQLQNELDRTRELPNQAELLAASMARLKASQVNERAALAACEKGALENKRLQQEVERLLAENTVLGQELAKHSSTNNTHVWLDLLEKRGLSTPDEIRSAMRTLLLNDSFLKSYLSTDVDRESVAQLLDSELCLSCLPPDSLPISMVVAVAQDKCEIANGQDLEHSLRRFIDAILVYGYMKVLFIAANSKDAALLRHFVQHHAIDVLCIEKIKTIDLHKTMTDRPDQKIIVEWTFQREGQGRIVQRFSSQDQIAYEVTAPSVYSMLMAVAQDLLEVG